MGTELYDSGAGRGELWRLYVDEQGPLSEIAAGTVRRSPPCGAG